MKDYYSILGVDRNATSDEIKKAYKKLAIKWHPDRQNGKTEEEKKAAEAKFKEVNEAYQILSDPQKKQEYDNPGFGGGFSGGGFGRDPWEDLFRRHEGPSWMTQNPLDFQGENCEAKLNMDIDDFYFKGIKSVAFLKKFRCTTCGGEGGTGITNCPYCGGTGTITEHRQQGNMFFQSSRPCSNCDGTGKTIEKKCASCSGTGFIGRLVKEDIDLSKIPVQYLMKDGIRINVGGLGSEAKKSTGKNGNLFVTIQHAYDHDKYYIDDYGNVSGKEDIDWKDVILGGKVKLHLPGDHDVTINIPECTEVGKRLRIKGKGIDGHDYIMIVNPTFPVQLDNDTKKALKKLKEKEEK